MRGYEARNQWRNQMSAKDQLRNSGMFCENDPQRRPVFPGSVCFPLRGGERGASIYATDVGNFQIRQSPLDLGKFPNNERLYEFVRANYFRMTPNNANAFMLDDSHIGEVIDIIRERTND